MNLILTDGCGNNYPVSPCPPPSTTVPPPPNTAETGGNVAEPVAIGFGLVIVGALAIASARQRRRGRA